MNNEETIIMQPQNNNKAQQSQNVETTKEDKQSNTGKRVAATAAAAGLGGVMGGAGAYAANEMYEAHQAEEQEVEAKVDEEATPAAATTEKSEATVETKVEPEEVPVTVDENGEPDYPGYAGADPVVQNIQTNSTDDDGGDVNEVQVLGVYEAQGEDGQTMEAAVLTNGQEVAAVVDVDGDGMVDALLVDENMNQQIDEGEVYDVSQEHVQMSQYEDAYIAEQQEQMQQEQDTFAYNADDQQDYNNDADLTFA